MRYKIKRKNSKQFNERFKKRFFTRKSGLVWLFALIIILGMGVGYMKIEQRAESYQATIDELSTEIKELKEDNESLEKEIEDVSSDEYIEKIARERLGMVEKGEYTLKESKDSTEDKEETDSDKEKKKKKD